MLTSKPVLLAGPFHPDAPQHAQRAGLQGRPDHPGLGSDQRAALRDMEGKDA